MDSRDDFEDDLGPDAVPREQPPQGKPEHLGKRPLIYVRVSSQELERRRNNNGLQG